MPKHRVMIEDTLIVTHFMTIEAESPREAKLRALELYYEFEESGEEPKGVEYRESGIGGDDVATLVSVDGGPVLDGDPEPIGSGEYFPWKEAKDAEQG